MNGEEARQGLPTTSNITAADDTTASGERQHDSFIRERNAALTAQVRMLHAEWKRTERLLAQALRIATKDGEECDPLELLQVIALMAGEDLAKPAWKQRAELDRLVALVRPLRCERNAA